MKKAYLILAIIGFILPTSLVILESIETGNIMLSVDPGATLAGMFSNRISTIFMIDLLFATLVFFIWSFVESRKHKIKNLYLVWILTFVLGIAGAFPLFLYMREKAIED